MRFPGFISPRSWSFETASFWSLLVTIIIAVIVLIPLASVPFLYTKVSVLAIGAIITLVFYILARLTIGNIVTPPLTLLGALWLVPLAYGVSTIFSSAPLSVSLFGSSFEADTLGFILLAGVLGTLSALTVRRIEQHRTFLKIGSWLLGFVLFSQIVILILGLFTSSVNPGASIVGSFADFSILVGLGVVTSIIALRFMNMSTRTRIMLNTMILVGLFFLILANTTLTWVLVGLTALGIFVESVMRQTSHVTDESFEIDSEDSVIAEEVSVLDNTNSRASIGMPLFVLAVSIFFLIGGSTIGGSTIASSLDSALHVNASLVRPSWQSTIQIGQHTYNNHAVFGSGPNTFGKQWLAYRNTSINTTPFWTTDFTTGIGFVPTSFVTTGIIGMVAWVLFIVLLLFFGMRALLVRNTEDSEMRAIAIVVFVGMTYMLFQLVFSVPGPVLIAIAFVFAGVFVSALRYFEPRGQRGIIFSQSPRIGFIIVFALTLLLLASVGTAYVVVERYIAQVDLVRAGNALSVGNLTEADSATSQSLLFVASDDAYRMEALIGINHIRKTVQNMKSKPTSATQQKLQAFVSKSVAAATFATRLNPYAYQNWYMLGNVYQTVVPLKVPDSYKKAQESYKKAESLNPTSPVIPFTLARLAIANKSYKEAEPLLKKAIALKPDYTQAIFLLSQLNVQLGKADEALKEAEAAAYFAPSNPYILFQVGVLREETGDYKGAIAALSQAVASNPSYANARYFLASAYAHQKEYGKALKQMHAIAKLSSANAKAVKHYINSLEAGNNPFAGVTSKKSAPSTSDLPALSQSTKK
ncbi:MAG TPA: tetratricopeptide repeat protein [Candidatus Kaiserbacteria bacterium]|nr:tetratricopeptide repeat protein [Candidatus Kaiserbacteria bacterium]